MEKCSGMNGMREIANYGVIRQRENRKSSIDIRLNGRVIYISQRNSDKQQQQNEHR